VANGGEVLFEIGMVAFEGVVDIAGEDFLLALEIVVQQAVVDACLPCDFADGDAIEGFCEQGRRGGRRESGCGGRFGTGCGAWGPPRIWTFD
jgi:hypothetical protein